MRVSVQEGGPYWKVTDLDTGREIKYCVMADDETGEYEAWATDSKGMIVLGADDIPLRRRGVARLRLERIDLGPMPDAVVIA